MNLDSILGSQKSKWQVNIITIGKNTNTNKKTLRFSHKTSFWKHRFCDFVVIQTMFKRITYEWL